MPSWSREQLEDALERFVRESDDLRPKGWASWAAQSGSRAPVAYATLARNLGRPYPDLVVDAVVAHLGDAAARTFPKCPNGQSESSLHQPWHGTLVEYRSGVCPGCAARRAKDDERQASVAAERAALQDLPTFAERFPDVVPYLADPADAQARGVFERLGPQLSFCCSGCGREGVLWYPSRGTAVPMCPLCEDAGAPRPLGSPVMRDGGGEPVPLERELARYLFDQGLPAAWNLGIAIPSGIYYRLLAIKPDIVVLDPPVAIELDHSVTDEHGTAKGEADDRERDGILASLGWRVLRVRRPSMPSDESWPWRIETESTAKNELAKQIIEAIEAEFTTESSRISSAPGGGD